MFGIVCCEKEFRQLWHESSCNEILYVMWYQLINLANCDFWKIAKLKMYNNIKCKLAKRYCKQ